MRSGVSLTEILALAVPVLSAVLAVLRAMQGSGRDPAGPQNGAQSLDVNAHTPDGDGGQPMSGHKIG